MQHVEHVGALDARGVVHPGVREARDVAELFRAALPQLLHLLLGAEMQAAGGARLDAGGLQAFAHAVRAERALEHLARGRAEFRDVERAAGDAVAAADTLLLLEIDDAVGVLDDGAVGRAGDQAARLLAVHALVLAHQQHQVAAVAVRLVLVELDQVPEVIGRLGHGLITVLERGVAEREVVPLQAGDLAGLAADAGRGVDQLGDLRLSFHADAGDGARMGRDPADFQVRLAHGSPPRPSRASPGSP